MKIGFLKISNPFRPERKSTGCLSQSAAFLDLDGVLWSNEYSGKLRHTSVSSEVRHTLKWLHNQFDALVVITNQTHGARSSISPFAYKCILRIKFVFVLLRTPSINSFFVCSHHPEATNPAFRTQCDCRKPKPGLIHAASKTMNLDVSESIFIGDRITDMYAAQSAGVKSNYLVINQKMFEFNSNRDFDWRGRIPIFKFLTSFSQIAEMRPRSNFLTGNFQVLYLSAGKGRRLHPLTNQIPKPLLEVQGSSILERLLINADREFPGASHIVNISHLASSFTVLPSQQNSINLSFSYEEEPIGSSRTLLNLAQATRFKHDVLVFHGDLVLSTSYFKKLAREISELDHSCVIGHVRKREFARSSIRFDSDGTVNFFENLSRFSEDAVVVNSGVYFFKSNDLRKFENATFEGEIPDEFLPLLIAESKLKCKIILEPRLSVDSIESLMKAQDFIF